MENLGNRYDRRGLLHRGAAAALALAPWEGVRSAEAAGFHGDDPWRGLKVGVASYSLRTLPLERAIQAVRRVGLRYVSIKDAHLPLRSTPKERREVAQRFKDAGITPLSCGNITLPNDEAEIRRAFEYARDAGLPTIVCSPHPDSFAILDRMVKEFGIRLAIHNHGPEDKQFPTPAEAWKAARPYDERIGLCIDVGHTARAGADPAAAILRYRSRLYDLHFKDVTDKGAPVEVGRGILDKPAVLRALLKIRYPHLVSFEYEKDADDPLPGLAESVGYAKGLLADLR